MMLRIPYVVAILIVMSLGQFLPHANAQVSLRRLTTTGDVLEFVWAPRGDALYVTRAGRALNLSSTRTQMTGDLYRVTLANAQNELLAQNANHARPSPSDDEIAFTRLNQSGSARAIVYDTRAQQELDVGETIFGALPQWKREGGTLYLLQDGKMRRATRTERATLFANQTFPDNARVSASGDRVVFLDAMGLWVTQEDSRRVIARSENGVTILPQFVWSNAGDKLAFVVTHNGFQPELWIADTTRGATKKIARGELEYLANLAWSPDDAFVIFTRTPTGSSNANTSEIWRARVDGSEMRALTHNHAAETLPQFSPDGKSIAFLREGDAWVMDLGADGLPIDSSDVAQTIALDYKTPRSPNAQRTPPATIRVKHDAANACRSAPIGQIDTLDFETYVKRVVPAEVYASWDDDALKTQAVAARSYAWFWILQHDAWEYDVTDSTAYQYMCDTRYASTDNATEATRGQYLDYAGYVVFAAYGAENGDPTLTNTWGNPYLLGVDDPVGFAQTRAGNGIGYSQWGAQRWATQYDWSYQQILRHYYTDVTLEASAGASPDGAAPIGALVAPWSNWGIPSNRVWLRVNASDDASGIASIDLNAQFFDGATTQNHLIATLNGTERDFVWDLSALPNQTGILVTPTIHDANGNTFIANSISFDLDRKKPQGTLNAPATTTTRNVSLALDASDNGGSGLDTMMFSNAWEWQGENQSVQTNSGTVVSDADALNGSALRGLIGANPPGAWYGPYTDILPTQKNYRAYFRLKTDNVTTTDEIAMLDVVADGGANVLGLKRLHGVDFKSANEYQEFYVDFAYDGFTTNALEFRVAYRATASLWLDRILLVSYPASYAAAAAWTLSAGAGTKRVIAKFADGAGNVSPDAVASILFDPNPTPVLTPRVWLPFVTR
ncbi:MAG: PD40 domain-containing protein [Chloroflexi bacterium]|nr:PD40 domain-containing protein [Chloroflexota bacterium]